jgi:hypothetical protein
LPPAQPFSKYGTTNARSTRTEGGEICPQKG